MAIEIVGGVYCPLSPRDPEQRLHQLVKTTHAPMVLVHWLTKTKFVNGIRSLNVDEIMINCSIADNMNVNFLSDILMSADDIAYVIFTSGSTGVPKGVSTTEYILN